MKALRQALFTGLLFMSCGLFNVYGQTLGRVEQTTSTTNSFYVHTRSGDLTIQVYVMGAARYPGLYEISVGTDLRQLLALSGGPNRRERLESDESWTIVRLFREDTSKEGAGNLDQPVAAIFEGLLENTVTNPQIYPVLQEGDLVTLDLIRERGFTWRDAFPIVSALGVVALAIERISSSR